MMGVSFTGIVVGIVHSLITGFTEGVSSAKTLFTTILDVNHNAMSTVFRFLGNVISVMGAIANCLYVVACTILVCIVDFICELKNFVVAFLYLLWKLLILLYSFLDMVFRTLESFAYFLWTGGQWTAATIKVSAQTFTENGLSTWKYFVLSLKELTNSVIGGFMMIGQLGKEAAVLVVGGLSWCHEYFTGVIYYIDETVRHAVRYIMDCLYHICVDYIPNLPQEIFLGVLICFVFLFLCRRILSHMGDRGLTFPLSPFGSSIIAEDEDDVTIVFDDTDGRVAEFSDDDFIDLSRDESDNDDSDFSGDSNEESDEESDRDADDDEAEEFEINSSDSETESNAPSESGRSEISIVLPHPDRDDRQNQSRSSTPARFVKDMSPSNLQRIIDDEKEKRKCVVCQDKYKSVLILPCRHMCLCVDCGNHIARSHIRTRRVCPLCRTKIRTIMNVYM